MRKDTEDEDYFIVLTTGETVRFGTGEANESYWRLGERTNGRISLYQTVVSIWRDILGVELVYPSGARIFYPIQTIAKIVHYGESD